MPARRAQWCPLSVASAIQSALGAGNHAVIALQRAARLLLGDMQRGFIRDYAAARQSINAAADSQLSRLEWPKPARLRRLAARKHRYERGRMSIGCTSSAWPSIGGR